jgi:hypothetical protein
VRVGDSQIFSQVPDLQIPSQVRGWQPIGEYQVSVSDVPADERSMASLVAKVVAEVAERMASTKKKKSKNRNDAEKAMKVAHKGTMKWLPFMSKSMPEKMGELIKTGIRTNKDFKEVHLTILAKALLKNYGADVSSTRVYNQL